eukprot:m.108122 g.108122  ORF g.108122 m.108122 type:complete len:513 (+) comp13337_c0_seq1:100-1638(+)
MPEEGELVEGSADEAREDLLTKIQLTRKQRLLSLIVCGLFFFFSGVEYAVILPTLWLFLQELHEGRRWFFGLTITVFSIANILSSPLFGLFADQGARKIKPLMILGVTFMILGNAVYFFANDAYCILEARFLCGFGAGFGAALMAYLARVTTPKERTPIIGTTSVARQFGVLVGPGLNFGLEKLSVQLGPFILDSLSAPGFIMTVLWAIALIVVLILFTDASYRDALLSTVVVVGDTNPTHAEGMNVQQQSAAPLRASEGPRMIGTSLPATGIEGTVGSKQVTATTPLLLSAGGKQSNSNMGHDHAHAQDTLGHDNPLLQRHMIVLFLTNFLTIFTQMALETWLTPLTQEFFGWGETNNSYMYIVLGGIAVISFIFVRILASKDVSDRVLLLIGLIIEVVGVGAIVGVSHFMKPHTTFALVIMSVTATLIVIGLPFLMVATPPLISKFAPDHLQGRAQAVMRMCGAMGMILAPLWAGVMSERMLIFTGVLEALEVSALVAVLWTFSRLKTTS